MSNLFTWSDNFLTGVPGIDRQHRHLIELINQLSEIVFSIETQNVEAVALIKKDLFDYVQTHFECEEKLMGEAGLDGRHVTRHEEEHRRFVEEATELAERIRTARPEGASQLAEYLIRWLAFHILDVDQSMARQLTAISEGKSPETAFEIEERSLRISSEPLLDAMRCLFHVVSDRNSELRHLNQNLEKRITMRTAELENLNRQLQLLSVQDDLTGLANRRNANQILNMLWHESKRYGTPLSLLLIDADNFKEVNDRFGHQQGDEVLKGLANLLNRSVRSSDVVCRLGGDEFLIICPHTTKSSAAVIATTISKTSAPFFTPSGDKCWDGRVSIGIAEAEPKMLKPQDLLAAADKAMYIAKLEHRNDIL